MNQQDRTTVVENYYKASNALMAIGTIKDVPEELKQLAIKASAATMKIIDYVNTHKEDQTQSMSELYKKLCGMFPSEAYGSYASVFNAALNAGVINAEDHAKAREHYGEKMWNYSGD